MNPVDLKDVQGLVASGYSNHHFSAYLFFAIAEGREGDAKKALAQLTDRVCHAGKDGRFEVRLNLAFAYSGLTKLGVAEVSGGAFPRELRRGMSERHRILGDAPPKAEREPGDPVREWEFSDPDHHRMPDLLVILHAVEEEYLVSEIAALTERLGGALDLVHTDRAHRLPDNVEHFGFRDGISNPHVQHVHPHRKAPKEGEHEDGPAVQASVKTGEFILGYRNEYDRIPFSPIVPASADRHGNLAAATGGKDLGRNGTYLVYRKLEQDVAAFRKYLTDTARARVGEPGKAADDMAEWIGARMMGRWKSGVPTQLAPKSADEGKNPKANGFTFGDVPSGRDGTKCPYGSHIRRANPRDALFPDKQESLQLVARHRVLRRGRPYGTRAPAELPEGDRSRGILFICLNANIERQFEFVQQTWLNNPKFDGLYDEVDPIVGKRQARIDRMSIQEHPTRHRIKDLPEFVRLRGGGYFFLPSLSAIRFLLDVPPGAG